MSVRKAVAISPGPESHAAAGRMLGAGRYDMFGAVVRAGPRRLDRREPGFQGRRAARSKAVASGPPNR